MRQKIILLTLAIISVSSAFAQKRIVENAIKDVALVPAKSVKAIDDQKACDVFNKSSSRTITVRIEETILVNNFLQKKVIAIEKIGPKEQKFVGYAGCEANVLYEKCTGYKIAIAYYEEDMPNNSNSSDKVAQAITTPADQGITAK